MEFNTILKDHFYAVRGAYSLVTKRENYDSQITLTDLEADIATDYFGTENIHHNNVKSNPEKAAKQFHLYPSYEPIGLNLIFPKPDKPELRLYLAETRGFKPPAGEVWFIFLSLDNRLVIGSMDINKWNSIGDLDEVDILYTQNIIDESANTIDTSSIPEYGKKKEEKIAGRTRYARDPKIALKRLTLANYMCEVDADHETFLSSRTNKQFVEAHHLIPMGFQSQFVEALDNIYNIFSLCPNCHRAIHYSTPEHKRELLYFLYEKREELQAYEFSVITELYNCTAPEE